MILDTLTTVLEGDTKALTRSLTRAKGQFKGYAKSTNTATKSTATFTAVTATAATTVATLGAAAAAAGLAVGAAAVGAAGVAYWKFSRSVAAAGDELHKLGLRTGISGPLLSKFKVASDLADLSLGDMALASKRLSAALYDANKGLKESKVAFEDLGLDIEALTAMSPEKKFDAVVKALDGIEDPSLRAALAQKVLGRSGANMLSLLEDGYEGYKKNMEEAGKNGVLWSKRQIKEAAKFTDSIALLKHSVFGLFRQFVNLGALTKVLDKLRAKINELRESVFVQTVAGFFDNIEENLKTLLANIRILGRNFVRIVEWAKQNWVEVSTILVKAVAAMFDSGVGALGSLASFFLRVMVAAATAFVEFMQTVFKSRIATVFVDLALLLAQSMAKTITATMSPKVLFQIMSSDETGVQAFWKNALGVLRKEISGDAGEVDGRGIWSKFSKEAGSAASDLGKSVREETKKTADAIKGAWKDSGLAIPKGLEKILEFNTKRIIDEAEAAAGKKGAVMDPEGRDIEQGFAMKYAPAALKGSTEAGSILANFRSGVMADDAKTAENTKIAADKVAKMLPVVERMSRVLTEWEQGGIQLANVGVV